MKVRDLQLSRLGAEKEQKFYEAISDDMEKMSTPWDSDDRMVYGDMEEYQKRMAIRESALDRQRFSSETERHIWNQLKNSTIQGEFRGTLIETVQQMPPKPASPSSFIDGDWKAKTLVRPNWSTCPLHSQSPLEECPEHRVGMLQPGLHCRRRSHQGDEHDGTEPGPVKRKFTTSVTSCSL